MSEWKARRFWTDAAVEAVDPGFAVRLDGRPVRTPLKAELIVPSRALAEEVAKEWQAQEEAINPASMPLTRAVNVTLDKVIPHRPDVAAGLSAYGESDLLCYRADGPDGLVQRQAAAWDPLLDWAATRFQARLAVTSGVMPIAQPEPALAALRSHLATLTPWDLTPLSEFVSLSGSLILGLAVLEGEDPGAIWPLSRIDETWQAELWGEDEEEADRVAAKRGEFLQAYRFLSHLRGA